MAEAEPLYQRALGIAEKAYGPEHPNVVIGLNSLAEFYRDWERFAEAGPLYKRSLAIHERAPGVDHPGVSPSLNNLAAVYTARDRYAETAPLYERDILNCHKDVRPRPSLCKYQTQQPSLAVLCPGPLCRGGAGLSACARHRRKDT